MLIFAITCQLLQIIHGKDDQDHRNFLRVAKADETVVGRGIEG